MKNQYFLTPLLILLSLSPLSPAQTRSYGENQESQGFEESSKPAQTREESYQAVWLITDSQSTSSGTAFFISPNQAVTNFHVLWMSLYSSEKNSNSPPLFLIQKQNPVVLMLDEVLFVDKTYDLAIFSVKPVVSREEQNDTLFALSHLSLNNPNFFERDFDLGNFQTRDSSPYYLKINKQESILSGLFYLIGVNSMPWSQEEELLVIGYPKKTFEAYTGHSFFNLLNPVTVLMSEGISSIRTGISGSPILNEKTELVGIVHSGSINDYNTLFFSRSQHLIKVYERRSGKNCEKFISVQDCMIAAISLTELQAKNKNKAAQYQKRNNFYLRKK